jgi:hypothetical protein
MPDYGRPFWRALQEATSLTFFGYNRTLSAIVPKWRITGFFCYEAHPSISSHASFEVRVLCGLYPPGALVPSDAFKLPTMSKK